MKIEHFNIQHKAMSWHQYSRGKAYHISTATQLETQRFWASNSKVLSEREFEVDCFLSILKNIKRKSIVLVELGAGWGEWCLSLAGVVDRKIISMSATKYRCVAVEGNPIYCSNMKDNFSQQGISCVVINAAVSNHNGSCKFSTYNTDGTIAFSQIGGSVLHGLGTGILSTILNKNITVPQYTLKQILDMCQLKHIDILHMDIQGNEVKVIENWIGITREKAIDYMLIGTHGKDINSRLEHLLVKEYDLIINAYPGEYFMRTGIPAVKFLKGQDGLQLYQRKGL